MNLRRTFLLGAAAIASIAALLAIVAVLGGNFGETEGKLFATLGATFVALSTAVAGVALLGRGVSRPLGYVGVFLAVGGYALWLEQIWAQHDSDAYWRFLWTVLVVSLAVLVATTNRLMLSAPTLVRILYPATAAAAFLAALTVSVMIHRDNGDGWQLFAILLILAVLGEVLAPILDRYMAIDEREERLLGTVGGTAVFAVRGKPRRVSVAGSEFALREDEGIVVRAAT